MGIARFDNLDAIRYHWRLSAKAELPYISQNTVPAFAVRTPDELVGFRRIMGVEVDVIPLELLPRPVGHVAEVVRLGDPA